MIVATAASGFGENWPGWRGPDRSGVTSDRGAPVRWSLEKGVAWRVDLPGAGISNPIVWGDRVIVTSSDGPKQDELHVICLGLTDGRELWHARFWGSAPTLFHAEKSGMASPSPVTDGRGIYTFFGTGDVFCLDMEGGPLWQRSLALEYGPFENRFAASSSPLLHEGALYVQCDHYGASYLLAIDAETGENRWKVDRPEAWLSWSSPQLVPGVELGKSELLLCGSRKLDAFDPATGEKLWSLGGLAHECVPTPVVGQGLILAVSGPNGKTWAVRPGGRGEIDEKQIVWTSEQCTPFVPSGIAVDDSYFLVDDKGIGVCLDVATGETRWKKRLGGAYTASPVAAEGRIYFVNEEGTTLVLAAGRKYRELAKNKLDEPVYASPAIAQGRLLIRSARGLFCLAPAE